MNSVTSPASSLKEVWRKYAEQLVSKEVQSSLNIGIAASFTANSLIPFVGAPLVEAGLAPSIELGPYNQLFQVCLDYKSYFHSDLNVLILLFRLEDFTLDDLLAFLQGDDTAFERASSKIDLLVSALQKLRASFKGSIIVNLPPFPSILPAHTLSLENSCGLGKLHRGLTSRFFEQVKNIPGIRISDFDAIQREHGLSRSFDSRQWYLYRQPFTDSFLLTAGAVLARMIKAFRIAPKKCVVLDCDNTLWGGIIGEDGLGGIQLGDEFPGTAYRDFQRLLLYWRQQGVLLALASKNNEADVWEVFDKHSGMLLKREHISAWQINWEPKAENIPKIAKTLNIGTDSLVFIDDNPAEIDYMRQARAEVVSILLPEEPADIMATLRTISVFDRHEITQEDRQRSDMMKAEEQRVALGNNLSKEEFQKSLGLCIDFFPAREEDLDRITQLINKTNQFNLSTIRRSLDEVRELAKSPQHRIFGLRVSDKFGDYGLTGVVIAEIFPKGSELGIDTFLLSCRVLGRGVETALLSVLAGEAQKEGATELVANFIPTAKNAPAAAFLPDHHFLSEDKKLWRIAVSQIPAILPWISLAHLDGHKA